MPAEKLSITLQEPVAQAARQAAERRGISLSTWLSQASLSALYIEDRRVGFGRARLWEMYEDAAVVEFTKFAKGWSTTALSVLEAQARLSENRDGEPVLRVRLLVTDPEGVTWDMDSGDEMERALRDKATELGLPFASFNMIAEREPGAKLFTGC
jgi:hypothetical protein